MLDDRPWRRPLVLAYAAMALVALVPVWTVRHFPLGDLSEHLAAASVLHNYTNAQYDFARYYTLSLGLNPYWGYYGVLHVLQFVVGLDVANRLVLSFYVVGTPVGMGVLARRFGRSPWLGLPVFAVVWNFNLTTGFVPFCLGLALVPWALVAWDRFCETPSPGRTALAVALGVGVFFTHLLPFGMWLASAGLVGLLAAPRTWRRIAGRAAAWLVPATTGLLIVRHGSGVHMGEHRKFRFTFHGWRDSAKEIYGWVWARCTGHEDEVLAAVLGVAFVALVATAAWRRRRALADLRAEACFLVALVAYFVLPRSVLAPSYWWGINIRFATVMMMFAWLLVPGTLDGWRRWLLLPACLAGVGFAVDTEAHWLRAQRFCDGYDQIAEKVKAHERVLFVIGYPWHDPSVVDNYAQTYSAEFQAFHGGYLPWNFDEGFPLRYRVRYPAPGWREMWFRWAAHAPYYDLVATFQSDGKRLFGAHAKDATLVAASGKWQLWRMPGPRIDAPPGPAYPPGWATSNKWEPPSPRR